MFVVEKANIYSFFKCWQKSTLSNTYTLKDGKRHQILARYERPSIVSIVG